MGGIPEHDHAGVIPPYIGHPISLECSPYVVTLADVVARFGTSANRRAILRGLVRYRAELRAEGLEGFQWLDGGFLDKKPEEPKDVDVVTFYRATPSWDEAAFLERRPDLAEPFEPFLCDGYFVNLDHEDRRFLVRYIAYWVGLFSHQRVTSIRRGLLQVDLGPSDDDAPACAMLDTLDDLAKQELVT